MTKTAIALIVIALSLALLSGSAASAAGAGKAWGIVNPEGDYDAQLENQKAVLDLLRNEVTVYWFVKGGGAPAKLQRGDYVVLSSAADAKYAAAVVAGIPADRRLELSGVAGWKGYRLSFPRVMLDGNKYSKLEFYDWYYRCLRRSGLRFGNFGGSEAGQLEGYNVLVVAGGSGGPDEQVGRFIRDFQKRGGAYVGSCNACLIAKQAPKDKPKDRRISLGLDLLEAQCPVVLDGGYDSVTTEVAADHPVMWHVPAEFTIRHANGPVMESTGPSCTVLATLKEAKWKSDKKAVAEGKAIWLAGQRPGEGRVVIFGNHPEFGTGKYPDGHRGVYDAIFWCTAGEELVVEPGKDKAGPPADWFELGGSKPGEGAVAAAQEKVARAVKANAEMSKSKADWRGLYPKMIDRELSGIQASLEKMKMTGGGDKAGWFAKRREELLAELLTTLGRWPAPPAWGAGESLRILPTESAIKLEEWVRDYGYFLKASGH